MYQNRAGSSSLLEAVVLQENKVNTRCNECPDMIVVNGKWVKDHVWFREGYGYGIWTNVEVCVDCLPKLHYTEERIKEMFCYCVKD